MKINIWNGNFHEDLIFIIFFEKLFFFKESLDVGILLHTFHYRFFHLLHWFEQQE